MSEFNKRISKVFGEYTVPYKLAKKLNCFEITWNIPYDDAVKAIETFVNTGEETETFYKLDCICCMVLGHIDVEFMSYGSLEEKFDSGFFCCYEDDYTGWNSHGFSDMVFDMNLLKDKNKFERAMFKSMLEYAKENQLKWSSLN